MGAALDGDAGSTNHGTSYRTIFHRSNERVLTATPRWAAGFIRTCGDGDIVLGRPDYCPAKSPDVGLFQQSHPNAPLPRRNGHARLPQGPSSINHHRLSSAAFQHSGARAERDVANALATTRRGDIKQNLRATRRGRLVQSKSPETCLAGHSSIGRARRLQDIQTAPGTP